MALVQRALSFTHTGCPSGRGSLLGSIGYLNEVLTVIGCSGNRVKTSCSSGEPVRHWNEVQEGWTMVGPRDNERPGGVRDCAYGEESWG